MENLRIFRKPAKTMKAFYRRALLYVYNTIIYSCNMGMSGLPDLYTQSTRATGPRAEGIYIRQTTSAYLTTVMYHLGIGQKSM